MNWFETEKQRYLVESQKKWVRSSLYVPLFCNFDLEGASFVRLVSVEDLVEVSLSAPSVSSIGTINAAALVPGIFFFRLVFLNFVCIILISVCMWYNKSKQAKGNVMTDFKTASSLK